MKPTPLEGRTAEELESRLLLEAIFLRYGYDFRDYAEASMERRLRAIVSRFGFADLADFLRKVLRDEALFRQILPHLTVTTSEMFRDPTFFLSLRRDVVPHLRTFPTINVWIAGCSTGQEVYSLAILFQEEGLYEKTVFFATDLNPAALQAAQEGIYTVDEMRGFTQNYQRSGGTAVFSEYYTADYGFARMNSSLKSNVVFSEHNLVTDEVFTECHLVLCRNVLIYFNRELQERALGLFTRSLRYRGFLGLGSKETMRFSRYTTAYEPVNEREKVYQKVDRAESYLNLLDGEKGGRDA